MVHVEDPLLLLWWLMAQADTFLFNFIPFSVVDILKAIWHVLKINW